MNERDWDAVAARFEQEIFNVPANDRKGLIKALVERFAAPQGTAADLGCGIGRTLPLLAANFQHVHAVEFSTECLAIARRKYRRLKNVDYLYNDLTRHPVPVPEVDLVLCINTLLLADLPHRMAMWSHMCACVKPGGRLVLVVPSVESTLLTRHRQAQWDLRIGVARAPSATPAMEHGVVMIDGAPTKHYLREELLDLLRSHGFDPDEPEKIEYDWSTEFAHPPKWMQAPFPWDWLVCARRATVRPTRPKRHARTHWHSAPSTTPHLR
jgi:SAM-dependent methyltransferase